MDKRSLSKRDICTKVIAPAMHSAGWKEMRRVRQALGLTKERIVVRGKTVARGEMRRADNVLSYIPHIPIAVIEVRDNSRSIGNGMQQTLEYAKTKTLEVPFAFSSNGDGFVFQELLLEWPRVRRNSALTHFRRLPSNTSSSPESMSS